MLVASVGLADGVEEVANGLADQGPVVCSVSVTEHLPAPFP